MAEIGNAQYISAQDAFNYAAQAGFTQQTVPGTKWTQQQVIVAIASAESGLDIHAYNPSDPNGGSFGILQINGFWFSHGISREGALNPAQAFRFAYTVISQHGTTFNDWSTFTRGTYKNKILDYPGVGNRPITNLPPDGWWTFPRIDNLGAPDPYGGFPKPDSNILVPDNYHIETILSGTVSGINEPGGKIDPWGASVTIMLDQPINDLATHIAYIHLANVTVRLGQHVNAGDRIGYNGGNFAAGPEKVPLGVALYHGNYYGHDGWQYMTYQNLTGKGKLNVVPVIEAAKNGALSTGVYLPGQNGGPSPFSSEAPATFAALLANATSVKNITTALTPSTEVAVVLEVVDELMRVQNPFDIIKTDSNPLDWFGEFAYAISLDLTALTIRGLFFLLGFYLCFKVFNQLVNITGFVQTGIKTGTDIARLAATAA